MQLCLKWKKPLKSAITLDTEDVEGAEHLEKHGKCMQQI